jgi:hypothetical protein
MSAVRRKWENQLRLIPIFKAHFANTLTLIFKFKESV